MAGHFACWVRARGRVRCRVPCRAVRGRPRPGRGSKYRRLPNPPVHQEDPVLEWVRAALTRTPPGVQPRTPTIGLAEELKRAGMTGPWDLQGLTVPECVGVSPLLAGYSVEFVRSLQQAQNNPKQGVPNKHREGAQPAAQEAVPDAVVEPALAALRVLALARRDSQMLPPESWRTP